MDNLERYGKYAYDAYCESSHGQSLISGDLLPPWDDLSTEIQRAWIHVSVVIIDAYTSTH